MQVRTGRELVTMLLKGFITGITELRGSARLSRLHVQSTSAERKSC